MDFQQTVPWEHPFSLYFRNILKLNTVKQTGRKIDHINTNKNPNRQQTARPLTFWSWLGEQTANFGGNYRGKATNRNFEEKLM